MDSFLQRNESWAKLMAWGFFFIFLAGSVAIPASLIIEFNILLVWVGVFIAFSFVMLYLELKDAKYKFKFWIEVNAFNGPRLKSFYVVHSGAILCAFLLMLMLPLFIDPDNPEDLDMTFLFTTLFFLSLLPLFYFGSRYRLKTDEGKRTKQFHAQVDEVEKAVVSTLRSLKVTYRRTDKDQKWTLRIPTFQIVDYGTVIKIQRLGRSKVMVTIQSSDPLAAPKIREIEKGIDSALGLSISD